MPNYTTHLNLAKPLPNESADITVINANMDAIDSAVNEVAQDVAELSIGIRAVEKAVDNIELTASKVSIADSANVFTSADVEGALNELFTSADNGKKAIATVVGSPLTNADSFSQMATKFQTLKDTFAVNLTNIGKPTNNTAPLQVMINTVPTITPRSATGSFDGRNFDSGDLGFTPRTVVVHAYYSNREGEFETFHVRFIHGNLKTYYARESYSTSGGVVLYNTTVDVTKNTGILVRVGGFSFSENILDFEGATFSWYAYE